MKICKLRFLSLFLTGVLLLGGCKGASQEEIPLLAEPVAANAAFRPVELGAIGKVDILYGTVVPMEYCCFYDAAIRIAELAVEVGDYVKKGDVIAYADINRAREQLESLNLQLENEQQNYERNEQIAGLQIDQIASREVPVQDVSGNILPANDVSANMIDVEVTEKLQAMKETELGVAAENRLYDGMLHDYRVGKLQEAIAGQQKIISEGTLRASHSGYVIYTKNLGISTDAAAFENIAVLADPEETCIELTDKTLDKYPYGDYEVKYLRLAGKTYDVTELSYGMDAEVLAKAAKKYPNVRLSCPEASGLTIGETYPIFYREKKAEEVPVIGLDSLKGEKDAYYVYVKTEDGDRRKQAVTIGESDSYYAQVLSGLEPGEEVYYESEARMPAGYAEYTVELSDYRIENVSWTYRPAEEQVVWYDAEGEGTVTEIAVKSGDAVEAGALLYVIKSDAGKAALASVQKDINQENITYAERLEEFDDSLSKEKDETLRKILLLQRELEDINHMYRLNQLEKTYGDMAENNDGTGKICVYAQKSGTVTGICVKEGTAVTEGSHILSMGHVSNDKLLVLMKETEEMERERSYLDNIAEFGENVTITIGDRVYEGTCIGMTAHKDNNLDKYYISATEDGPAISYCTESGYDNPAFYVKMEDKGFGQNKARGKVTFSYVVMEDVIVVPTALVYEEENFRNPSRTDYYVWRVVGNELVKQYVQINKAYSDVNTTVILSGVEEKDVLAK